LTYAQVVADKSFILEVFYNYFATTLINTVNIAADNSGRRRGNNNSTVDITYQIEVINSSNVAAMSQLMQNTSAIIAALIAAYTGPPPNPFTGLTASSTPPQTEASNGSQNSNSAGSSGSSNTGMIVGIVVGVVGGLLVLVLAVVSWRRRGSRNRPPAYSNSSETKGGAVSVDSEYQNPAYQAPSGSASQAPQYEAAAGEHALYDMSRDVGSYGTSIGGFHPTYDTAAGDVGDVGVDGIETHPTYDMAAGATATPDTYASASMIFTHRESNGYISTSELTYDFGRGNDNEEHNMTFNGAEGGGLKCQQSMG